jgi:polyisoprenoid-binding protein YceI
MSLHRDVGWSKVLEALLRASVVIFCLTASAQSQELTLQFSPASTSIKFTLGDILHTVHGSFNLKNGEVRYDAATGSVSGTVVVDARSGQSGNRMRDRRMHRDILESERYPEIGFRPDRVEGKVAATGTSTVQVHGMFSIHGGEHELTMPVRIQVLPGHWIADTNFTIPYVKWGIKDPSNFILRVSQSVEIEVHATGVNPSPGGLGR